MNSPVMVKILSNKMHSHCGILQMNGPVIVKIYSNKMHSHGGLVMTNFSENVIKNGLNVQTWLASLVE